MGESGITGSSLQAEKPMNTQTKLAIKKILCLPFAILFDFIYKYKQEYLNFLFVW